MKNVTVKKVLVTAYVALTAAAGFNTTTMAQAPSVNYSMSIAHQKDAINNDLARIRYQQQRVEALKEKSKQERTNGTVSKATKNNLMKAKADLKRERGYLNADKTSLLLQHRSHISAHQRNLHKQRALLMAKRRNLEVDIIKGNDAAVAHAGAIIETKKQMKAEQQKLRAAKLDRNSDLLAINKQISNAGGQSVVTLIFENGFAQASNLVLK